MELEQKILQNLEAKIKSNRLVLPSMPDVFLQIKKIVDDPSSNMVNIAKVINRDPSLTARILKVANNALYRGNHEITNVQLAVSRMGLQLIKTLVTSHAITQMFNQPKGVLKPFFDALHKHSTEVSANAYAIATHYSKLDPDDALLAGLVHNIGYLPMARCIESFPEVESEPGLLVEVMGNVHTQVGEMILKSWAFPKNIIDASIYYVEQFRKGSENVDLTDIVIIASLNTYRGTDHPCTLPDWSQYPAFKKIGINTREELNKLDEIKPDIENARTMLGITSGVE
ncbi:MAG: HDOD domain-containing protein [Gammaproteobacteria bacterium]|nr:HDOD domain-containing protein [Gammaproteobacteria bacterium]MCW8988795.1 HDOD domain-containing protein [Gammaproteobacteria bacterium]MCW9031757.1 HDOD domain-containing protein [Gammaproteobacteria bacterium]